MDSSPSSTEQRGPGPHHRNIPATTASSLSWPDMGAASELIHGATHHTAALSLEMCHLCIRSWLVKKGPKLWKYRSLVSVLYPRVRLHDAAAGARV